jgi:Zn-dependent protease
MSPTSQGSFRLFRFRGIDVHVHWSWFVVAIYSVSSRTSGYAAPVWAAYEYLTLFLIVLLHEFGHSLACRQVGGQADQIVLWPLGGVAYVAPPPRPGATLWSIAAGPLVNLVLLPVFIGLYYGAQATGIFAESDDIRRLLRTLIYIDLTLLVFNLLPIYPLDGGQILQSLLWFPLGKARSLLASTVIGFIGGLGLIGVAIWQESIWTGIMTLYLLASCWRGFQHARELRRIERLGPIEV